VRSALILGSGPAAAGAAIAFSHRPDLQITVLDLGLQLEPELKRVVDVLAGEAPPDWDDGVLQTINTQPVGAGRASLPEKRSYGSDYPFRDVGQLEGVAVQRGANASIVSPAYGGFSTVWGAQIMPFAASVLDEWPVRSSELVPHYRAILDQIPFAAEKDDLAAHFPLLGDATPLPETSQRTNAVLAAYQRHRGRLNRSGVTLGKARLALDAAPCLRVGLCLTGCPYSLIYSAAHTFDRMQRSGRITYRPGLLALKVAEEKGIAHVIAKELEGGELLRFEADRVFVACGAMGTTRLVLTSLGLFERDVGMIEAQQFTLPALSLGPTADPRIEPGLTLNQFNMTVASDDRGYDLSLLHFYTYNPAFNAALPPPLQSRLASPARTQLLRRLSVALGYLPSWHSPRLRLHARRPASEHSLPEMELSAGDRPPEGRAMLRKVVRRVLQAGPFLDLYPVLPMVSVAAPGKSYHFGGSFPHSVGDQGMFSSDRLGRVGGWRRIHLVDASVFPTIPATTFTLTVMANAHRIASEASIVDG
jgi:choline dehydrogenase-like flavoprotein